MITKETVRVVLLSGQSLLSDAVARKLKSHMPLIEIRVGENQAEEALAHLTAEQPDVIILDSNDSRIAQLCHVFRMHDLLPDSRVICLCPTEERVFLVSCEVVPVHDIDELVAILQEPS